MEEHKCIIGLWNNYENTYLITLDDLKEEIKDHNSSVDYWKNESREIYNTLNLKKININDYCDRRKSTNIDRFEYCPYCGKEINWKSFKEE